MPALGLSHPRRSAACAAILCLAIGRALLAPAADTDTAPVTGAAPARADDDREERGTRRPLVPPVPEGTPDQLLAYVRAVEDPANLPRSRGRQRFYKRKAARACIEAADRILKQTQPDDTSHRAALAIKLDALQTLQSLDEAGAAAELRDFAATLANSPDRKLAAAARGLAIAAEIETLLDAGGPVDAAPLVGRLTALLETAPDDAALGAAAGALVRRLSQAGEDTAALAAGKAVLPLLEGSGNAANRRHAAAVEESLRRLALIGRPMPIEGRLLDGTAFDQQAFAGKVVLVDFWATWCGPCVAELPNIRAAYDKYHDRGFEVLGISLDDDRDTVTGFVRDRRLPWPVIHDGKGNAATGPSMAERYGVTGIPQLMLIGRDGNVITLNARGRKLEAALARLFEAK